MENWRKYIKLVERAPLAISILGTPASGKTYTKDLISALSTKFKMAVEKGKNLNIDDIRSEVWKMPVNDKLFEFFKAFYTLRKLVKEDKESWDWWFNHIKDTLNELLPIITTDIKITKNNFYIKTKKWERASKKTLKKFLKRLPDEKKEKAINSLHPYHGYVSVIRHVQILSAAAASEKTRKRDIVYDEVGSYPEEVIGRLRKLHNKAYVTDVVMIHPASVLINLIQNAYRMITGGGGGRDSSSIIVRDYDSIAKNMDVYTRNSERIVDTSSVKLTTDPDVARELELANVPDDKERGDKPIDVFVKVDTQSVKDTYERIVKDFSEETRNVLKAILVFQINNLKLNLPEDAREDLERFEMPAYGEARKIIQQVKNNSENVESIYGQKMTGVLNLEEGKRSRLTK